MYSAQKCFLSRPWPELTLSSESTILCWVSVVKITFWVNMTAGAAALYTRLEEGGEKKGAKECVPLLLRSLLEFPKHSYFIGWNVIPRPHWLQWRLGSVVLHWIKVLAKGEGRQCAVSAADGPSAQSSGSLRPIWLSCLIQPHCRMSSQTITGLRRQVWQETWSYKTPHHFFCHGWINWGNRTNCMSRICCVKGHNGLSFKGWSEDQGIYVQHTTPAPALGKVHVKPGLLNITLG